MSDSLTTDGWVDPTDDLLDAIAARCRGRGGAEDEYGVSHMKGDPHLTITSTWGAQTARVCDRNRPAILAVKVYDHGPDTVPVVWFRLDPDRCRGAAGIIKHHSPTK